MKVIPISRPQRPPSNLLDRLPALWNSTPSNPAVQARQDRSEETTRFQIAHDPDYAGELARLRSWIATYELPAPEEDQ
ncbi:hypothetical protein GCM10028787_10770 [Brachybacterium horti]